jgi:hypothetical protein
LIDRIGVICQDAVSRGFLLRIRDRLGCHGTFVDAPISVGISSTMTRTQAKTAWRHFEKQGVGLIVRFTDADDHRWQDVERNEIEVFSIAPPELFVCAARLVREVPGSVFKSWLENDSLRKFYSALRSAALRANCPVPNELDGSWMS